ncbi:MAG TPA: hypothetical protein VEP90_22825 [Methylomirabilota bacterium]|nr:hypothetical protein [Methylomirabilota bacterium]
MAKVIELKSGHLVIQPDKQEQKQLTTQQKIGKDIDLFLEHKPPKRFQ